MPEILHCNAIIKNLTLIIIVLFLTNKVSIYLSIYLIIIEDLNLIFIQIWNSSAESFLQFLHTCSTEPFKTQVMSFWPLAQVTSADSGRAPYARKIQTGMLNSCEQNGLY